MFPSTAARVAALLLVPLSMSGCASIMNGPTQEVGVTSEPSGASVVVDGAVSGATPLVVDLSRQNVHVVAISLPGYRTQELTLDKRVSGWVWGNVALGGLIGLAVDAASGSMYRLTPEQLSATLETAPTPGAPSSSDAAGDGLRIVAVLEPDPGWERIGTLARAPR